VVDISFTPTFRHTEWVDRVDRVVAAGPNGFNTRFNAIESDLRQVSTVVTQIGTALDQTGPGQVPPPTGDQRLTFTPTLGAVSPNAPWRNDANGLPSADLTGDLVFGLMNLNPPQHARLTTLTLRGEFGANANVNLIFNVHATLSRIPLRLTIPPAPQDDLASAGFTGRQHPGPFEFSSPVNAAQALVDLDTFRYLLIVSAAPQQANGFTITLRAVQLVYTFDS
jgi:hypothetical protein